MPEVKLAKTAGFCFGVKKAVRTVYEEIEYQNQKKENERREIYTYGPIIHNDLVVNDLRSKGAEIVDTLEDIKNLSPGKCIIIRSHGAPKEAYTAITESGHKLVDATCPFVKKIHKIVCEHSEAGEEIVIIGDEKHPEVIGIMGWCTGRVTVIDSEEKARSFETAKNSHICIVSQTTFNHNKFKYLVEIIEKKGYNIVVLNTICNATHDRQVEARQLSLEVDAMLVIGNQNSSNTRKLYEICSENCKKTYHVQSLVDLEALDLHSDTCVGITAGASTPNYIIEEVQTNVRKF